KKCLDHTIDDKASALKYLAYSQIYLEKNDPSQIVSALPVLPEGRVWNGYYRRQLNSPTLNYFGEVAIRVAFDKDTKVHHAYFPAFIIPHLKITVFDLEVLVSSFIQSFCVSSCLESY